MENNKTTKNSEIQENVKKRKSRFGVVLGVVVVSMGLTFSYLTISQKGKYTVLENSSQQVKSKISSIKDIRTLKGYKVIEKNGDNSLILISAGLSYDPNGSVEIVNVEFDKDSAKIIVKENIDKNPEKEKVTYPFAIVKISSEIVNLSVVNESGEAYEEIFLNQHTNEPPLTNEEEKTTEESDKSEGEKSEEEKSEEEKSEDEVEETEDAEEEVEETEEAPQTKTLTCVYEGKADSATIEISVGNQYKTFDISEVSRSFDNIEVGKQITIEYVDTLGNGKIVGVR